MTIATFATLDGEKLHLSSMFRSDKKTLRVIVKDQNSQENCQLKFVACLDVDPLSTAPWIIKTGNDWTLEFNDSFTHLVATCEIQTNDTISFGNTSVRLAYEIERLNGARDPTTLERGLLFVYPDLATN